MRSNEERNHWQTNESTGVVKIRAQQGLHALLARRVAEAARGFQSSVLLDDGSGHRADARNLLELLLLGVRRGDAVTLRCVGTDADAAFVAIAAVLAQGEVDA
jgi:phosphotransferase system HPr (HPr) family protein